MRVAVAIVLLALWMPLDVYGLTKKERTKVQAALDAVNAAITHNQILTAAAEAAWVEVEKARIEATRATESAQTADTKAKLAKSLEERQFKEFQRAATENAKMRKIVDAVSGPWWFPGGRALLYGAKKSAISLLVIIAGAVVIFIAIGFLVPGARPILNMAGGFFGKLGKGALAIVTRKGKAVVKKKRDNIKHRTIGSD